MLEELISAQMRAAGVSNIQAWIDGPLSAEAGTTAEWNILALCRGGTYDFSGYLASLRSYLATHTVSSAVSRQKYALIFCALGAEDAYTQTVCDETIGSQGIMSWIFGLHLLRCGCPCAFTDEEEAVKHILALQLADGGWCAVGQRADVDVTAMALQALAPYREEAEVSAAVNRGLETLASMQTASGDFIAYGVPNAESTAQVIIALSALDIDPVFATRWIRGGATLFDVLARYRTENGTYAHAADGLSDPMANAQILCACVAVLRMKACANPLYSIGDAPTEFLNKEDRRQGTEQVSTSDKDMSATESTADSFAKQIPVYRLWAIVGLLVLFAAAVIILRLTGRHSLRRILTLVAVFLILDVFLWLVPIRTPDAYYGEVTHEDPAGYVTLSIRCDVLLDSHTGGGQNTAFPADGMILRETEFVITEGETVYTLLIEAARAKNLIIDASGGYVSGIGSLYEFDYGDLSGWIYRVNGEQPAVGCRSCVLHDGDRIEWLYTCSLGEDLETQKEG